MHATTFVDRARTWEVNLERRESLRSGCGKQEARVRMAGRLSVPFGTLDNLCRRRVKNVAAWLFEKLRRAEIRELEAEERAHEHEITFLLASGSDPDCREVAEALAGLAKIRAALTEVRNG